MNEGTFEESLDRERNAHQVTTLQLDIALGIRDHLIAKQELDEMEAAVTYATATARLAEIEGIRPHE